MPVQVGMAQYSLSNKCSDFAIQPISTVDHVDFAGCTTVLDNANRPFVACSSSTSLKTAYCADVECRTLTTHPDWIEVTSDGGHMLPNEISVAFGPQDNLPVLAYHRTAGVAVSQCTNVSCAEYTGMRLTPTPSHKTRLARPATPTHILFPQAPITSCSILQDGHSSPTCMRNSCPRKRVIQHM